MLSVEHWMVSPVITVKSRDSVARARELMERRRINQLPVLLRDRLVGIVSDRDLRDAFPSVLSIAGRRRRAAKRSVRSPDEVPVEAVMTRKVLTLPRDAAIDSAARLIRKERIGAIPIVEAGKRAKLVGILTRSDLLDACAAFAERQRALADASRLPPRHASGEVKDNW